MILFVLAYLGGVLTIISPCILPVLPFVFARSDKSFVSSGLPMLAGMAVTFAGVATLAAVGGGWAVQANEYGRIAALTLLALFGLALLFPELSDRLTRPLVALGSRLFETADRSAGTGGSTVLPSLLLGVATGLLWAPCAGPVLGLILTEAALQGANVQTSLLLTAYAAGAATSLALALLIGGRVFAGMKRSLGAGEWVRRSLGAAVLAGVAAIALGLDTRFLTQVSLASTAPLEQGLVDKLHSVDSGQLPPGGGSVAMTGNPPAMTEGRPEAQGQQSAAGGPVAVTGNPPPMMQQAQPEVQAEDFPDEGGMPSLSGAVQWLNSPPLTPEALKGKVVVVDFWTYSCINCLRSIPYVRAWAEKYKDEGLVVIGVHTPEFAFEKNVDNVKKAAKDMRVGYPIALDSDYAIWRASDNENWPALYFVDAQGHIRHRQFGEGEYEQSERVIQQLLVEAGVGGIGHDLVSVDARGAEAAADWGSLNSPENYVGYERTKNFASPGGAVLDKRGTYAVPARLKLNHWALSGDWSVQK